MVKQLEGSLYITWHEKFKVHLSFFFVTIPKLLVDGVALGGHTR